MILAVDPGTVKCGIAVVTDATVVLHRAIVPTADLPATVATLWQQHACTTLVMGNATHSKTLLPALRVVLPPDASIHTINEINTTRRARERYWKENPPRGLWRLVPVGMRTPPVPVDDYAALLLAEAFLVQ
jgi:RNase H-fold protein (predicted Holliday junction resolvase)